MPAGPTNMYGDDDHKTDWSPAIIAAIIAMLVGGAIVYDSFQKMTHPAHSKQQVCYTVDPD